MQAAIDRPGPSPWVRRLFAPASGNSRWHVSPGVDLAGYAFSWVFIALPVFLWVGNPGFAGLLVYIATASIIDVHRHYTFSYVYLDREVRRSYPVRFWLLPALFLALWIRSPALAHSTDAFGAVAAGAMLSWLWLTVQMLWQDQAGPFQWQRAIPLFLGAGALAALVSGAIRAVDAGWIWLAVGIAFSLVLHRLLVREAAGDALARSRAHWVFPAGSLAIGGATLAVARSGLRLPLSLPTSLVAITFVVWQTYHVIMQKYGILRIYNAKSGRPEKVPAWVDRLLVFGVVPAFLAWAGSAQLDYVSAMFTHDDSAVSRALLPPLESLGHHAGLVMTLGVSFWVACAGLFAWHEWSVNQLRNAPRLWFALGTLLLYLTVFQLGMPNAYIAFATAHGIEYAVFLWAFQRRRYRDPLARRQASPLLRRPVLFYVAFTAVVTSGFLWGQLGDTLPGFSSLPRTIFSEDARDWWVWYSLYQGILHFYYDGFLWKLRRPVLLAQI